jgi:signal peptidase II
VAAAVVVADALSKHAVQATLAVGERHHVIPGVVVLTHVQNTGAAYGLLTGRRWLLVVTAAVIAVLTPLLLRALSPTGRWAWVGPVLTGMILGGAIGNLTERARRGYVTDFIQTPPVPLFQVFNISDACISVAITLLLVLSLFGGDARARRGSPGETRADREEAAR